MTMTRAVYALAGWTLAACAAWAQAETVVGLPDGVPGSAAPPIPRVWDRATLDVLATMPIQEGGRVKPIETFARYQLIKLSGRSSVRLADGSRRTAMEWLMDCLFDPATADTYPVLLIENPDVMQLLGLPSDQPRRRFSYQQVRPIENHLLHLAQDYFDIKPEERSLVQGQVINFYDNVFTYRELTHALDFARYEAQVAPDHPLASLFTQPEDRRFSMVLARAPEILALAAHAGLGAADAAAPRTPVETFLMDLELRAGMSTIFAILPPVDPARREWYSPGKMLREAFTGQMPPLEQFKLLVDFEQAVRNSQDPAALREGLSALRARTTELAFSRGEGRRLGMEVALYRMDLFYRALLLYGVGFLVAAFLWLKPSSRALAWGSAGATIAATAMLWLGIVMRSIINGRPPITNLYDTTLFVPAVAVVLALIVEWMVRNRIALSVATVVGMVGMFVANKYEMKSSGDTIHSLVAVLDSNFWLATHVVTITIGYSAGLLAAALGHLYIFGRAFDLTRRPEFYRSITRMVYGIVCFGLFFSFLGTVLGGIWANYSWGRFWGWDPKENGALLIVLAFLIITHARLGGYIRDLGISISAVASGMVVAFSWWGVNLLGVGLHSYGFTSGILRALVIFWGVEAAVIALGMTLAYRTERRLEWEAAIGAQKVAPAKPPRRVRAARPAADAGS